MRGAPSRAPTLATRLSNPVGRARERWPRETYRLWTMRRPCAYPRKSWTSENSHRFMATYGEATEFAAAIYESLGKRGLLWLRYGGKSLGDFYLYLTSSLSPIISPATRDRSRPVRCHDNALSGPSPQYLFPLDTLLVPKPHACYLTWPDDSHKVGIKAPTEFDGAGQRAQPSVRAEIGECRVTPLRVVPRPRNATSDSARSAHA
jgi:hypothetical protein